MYARRVEDRVITLTVSGMLWNRSLVMQDLETKTLWSHLLGRAMDGQLKGSRLKTIPSDILTWAEWKRLHPDTTVLQLSRTARDYNRESLNRPERFLIGFEHNARPYAVRIQDAIQNRAISTHAGQLPVLVTFDPDSAAARVFSRNVGDAVLDFESVGEHQVKDTQTGSVWDARSGKCFEGTHQGRTLEQRVGILSYTRAWQAFHPDTKYLK